MKVYKKLSELTTKYSNPAIALGMFDGVHVGHASIIRRAVELARENEGTAMVFTFSNHPLSILEPEHMPLSIGNRSLRRSIVGSLGVDVMIEITFTKEFSKKTPEEFLTILENYIAPFYVVTGQNFTFGRFGKGNGRMLIREGSNYGFKAEICPTITVDRKIVSSTRIRKLIADGDLSEVNILLGRPFTYVSKVIHGDKRGRKLGFPTANLEIGNHSAMLPNGVYAVEVKISNTPANNSAFRIPNSELTYCGIANIGDNPTFNVHDRRLEVYIHDFNKNIYGQEIAVSFLEKLRDEQKFDSVDDLVFQLRQDLKNSINIWRR